MAYEMHFLKSMYSIHYAIYITHKKYFLEVLKTKISEKQFN